MAALYTYKAPLVPPFVSMYKFGCPRMHALYTYKAMFFQHGQKQIHHTTNSKSLLYTMPRRHASTHSEDKYINCFRKLYSNTHFNFTFYSILSALSISCILTLSASSLLLQGVLTTNEKRKMSASLQLRPLKNSMTVLPLLKCFLLGPA